MVTQLELSDRLGRGELRLPAEPTVVMIQCVEQRSDERPYCSRVCCTTAVKNALAIRRQLPAARVMVLYRDMRTYGFREAAYREAREKGVLFVRYEPEQPPQVWTVRTAAVWRSRSASRPSAASWSSSRTSWCWPRRWCRGPTGRNLSELLRVPLNADGFFLEAHMKLRPVDFASEGLFLCGTAHAPKFLSESRSPRPTPWPAGRRRFSSKKQMPVGGQTAWVDPDKCISCMTCVHVCPYMAPRVNADNKAEVQGAACMGCGSCTAECPGQGDHAAALRRQPDPGGGRQPGGRAGTSVRWSASIRSRSAWPRRDGAYAGRSKKWPMFVVPALAGIRAKNRLRAGLQTMHLAPHRCTLRKRRETDANVAKWGLAPDDRQKNNVN